MKALEFSMIIGNMNNNHEWDRKLFVSRVEYLLSKNICKFVLISTPTYANLCNIGN